MQKQTDPLRKSWNVHHKPNNEAQNYFHKAEII